MMPESPQSAHVPFGAPEAPHRPTHLPAEADIALRRWAATRPWHLLGTNEQDAFASGWDAAFTHLHPALEVADSRLRVILDHAQDGTDLGDARDLLLALSVIQGALGIDIRERVALGEKVRKLVEDQAALHRGWRGDGGGGEGEG